MGSQMVPKTGVFSGGRKNTCAGTQNGPPNCPNGPHFGGPGSPFGDIRSPSSLNLGPELTEESERESSVGQVSRQMRTTEISTSCTKYLARCEYNDVTDSDVHRLSHPAFLRTQEYAEIGHPPVLRTQEYAETPPEYIPDFELTCTAQTQVSEISNPSSTSSISLAKAAGVRYYMPWIPVDPPPSLGNQRELFFEQMHIRTRMTNGRIGLLVDPGAFDNLCGSHWLVALCMLARQHGLTEEWYQLSKVLGVEGVGKQAQEVTHGVRVPIALDSCSEQTFYDSPVVQDSYIPALLGLKSLEDKESVLDMRVSERKLYCGPVDIVP